MIRLLLLTVLFLQPVYLFAQSGITMDCKTTLDLPVFLQGLKGDTLLTAAGLAEKTAKGGTLIASKPNITIISFTLSRYADKEDDIVSAEVSSPYLDKSCLSIIRYAKKGSVLTFECIKGRIGSGPSFTLRPLSFTL